MVYVDVTDEELSLIQDTDPAGTMMMSTKLLEVVQEKVNAIESQDKIAKLVAYILACQSRKERIW